MIPGGRPALTTPLATVICVLAFLAMPASVQVPFPPDSTVEALVQELVESHGVKRVVVGLLNEDGSRRVIAHGDPGPAALPLDGESVFEIGSMTKVFTGILVASVRVEQGWASIVIGMANDRAANGSVHRAYLVGLPVLLVVCGLGFTIAGTAAGEAGSRVMALVAHAFGALY